MSDWRAEALISRPHGPRGADRYWRIVVDPTATDAGFVQGYLKDWEAGLMTAAPDLRAVLIDILDEVPATAYFSVKRARAIIDELERP